MLDFWRGVLSARKLLILVRGLSPQSGLVRALNAGSPVFTLTDHLLADLWVMTVRANSKNPAKVGDHPVRAKMIARQNADARAARLVELKSGYEARKRLRANKTQEAV